MTRRKSIIEAMEELRETWMQLVRLISEATLRALRIIR